MTQSTDARRLDEPGNLVARPAAPLLFVHMPKAAGTSIQRVINQVYAGMNRRNLRGFQAAMADFLALPESERHGVDALCGHLHYPLVGALREPCHVLTMLREPVDRFLSLYAYIRWNPDHRLHERVRGQSLEEFVARPNAPEADNEQVRRLCSVGDGFGPVGSVTAEMLESAKRNLAEPRTVFGLAERFDESMELIRRELSWVRIPCDRANVTPDRLDVDDLAPSVRERIREANRLDVELYKFGVELFKARLRGVLSRT